MTALLVATLIGVFITPDGIVIGADTALSNIGGHVANQQKYCITGPRSVATMQGQYLLEDTVTKATVELQQSLPGTLCAQVGRSLSPMTLRQQADHLASGLKADLVEFLERLPAAAVVHLLVDPGGRPGCRDRLRRARTGKRRCRRRHRDRARDESMGGAGAARSRADLLGLRRPIPRPGGRRHRGSYGQRRAHPESRNSTSRRGEARWNVTRRVCRGDDSIGPGNVPSGGSAHDHPWPRLWCSTGNGQPADRHRHHSARRVHRDDTDRVVVAVPAHQRW